MSMSELWAWPSFRSLPDDGTRLLFLWLMTGPAKQWFRDGSVIRPEQICAAMDWDEQTGHAAVSALAAKALVVLNRSGAIMSVPAIGQIEKTTAEIRDEELAEAVRIWNDFAKEHGLATVREFNDDRKIKLRKRLKECHGLIGWRNAVHRIAGIPGLLGQGENSYPANFDFLLKPSKFTKLREGVYDNWNRGHVGTLNDAFDRISAAMSGQSTG